jgi:hemerythrin superfamily protein
VSLLDSMILRHHHQIEEAFAAVKSATDICMRLGAQNALGVLLTGHVNAEESVIYPTLVQLGHEAQGMVGYTEQAEAKVALWALQSLDPISRDYLDELEQFRSAVVQHMRTEERDRFPDLQRLSAADQVRLTERYQEEFERYVGLESPVVIE